jgi:peptidoglycan/LPS O-acetylase OafA/YrhL
VPVANAVITKTVRETSEGSVHLDALRGAAALVVFANHTRALYFTSTLKQAQLAQAQRAHLASTAAVPKAPNAIFDEGLGNMKFASEAVVIFFVLSGYLVGGSVIRSLRMERWSWRVYLTKRITRLWVVLIPAILIGVTLDYFGKSLFGAGSVYTQPPGMELGVAFGLAKRFHPAVLLGNALFLESILVPFPGTNVSIWSLVNEFWYYLAFPLAALAFTTKSGWRARLGWALGAGAVLTFVGWHITVLFPIWVFGALASIIPRQFSLTQAKLLSWTFGAVLLGSMVGVRLLPIRVVQAEYCIGLLASLFLWAIVQQTEPAKDGVYKAVSGFFSRISYTLYLFHLPIAVFLCGLLNSPWHRWPFTPKYVALFVADDALIVLLAYGLWRLFEANTDWIRAKVFEREPRIGQVLS